ncbi:hypothetical protein LB503_001158 [Fusarium chuoi]|nr:hypothetical protein LB503_001158 [Fusarium chuoi]
MLSTGSSILHALLVAGRLLGGQLRLCYSREGVVEGRCRVYRWMGDFEAKWRLMGTSKPDSRQPRGKADHRLTLTGESAAIEGQGLLERMDSTDYLKGGWTGVAENSPLGWSGLGKGQDGNGNTHADPTPARICAVVAPRGEDLRQTHPHPDIETSAAGKKRPGST